jgi:hypothetical protein
VNYVPLPLRWQSFCIEGTGMHRAAEGGLLRRMERIFGAWEGTPYRDGQAVKRVGTFCTAFLCAVLDELYRVERPTPLPEIPTDAAMHHPPTARAGLRWFLSHYPRHQEVTDGFVQPGDVLVTGPQGGGPGHGILVGPRENTLWQCSADSVHFTGMSIPECYQLFAAYRMTDRSKWL